MSELTREEVMLAIQLLQGSPPKPSNAVTVERMAWFRDTDRIVNQYANEFGYAIGLIDYLTWASPAWRGLDNVAEAMLEADLGTARSAIKQKSREDFLRVVLHADFTTDGK